MLLCLLNYGAMITIATNPKEVDIAEIEASVKAEDANAWHFFGVGYTFYIAI